MHHQLPKVLLLFGWLTYLEHVLIVASSGLVFGKIRVQAYA
jgi:hypothetical protein